MPMIVHSPYSGRQVKVRDQDIERAIRDPDGKVFYVVQRSDGKGHYASPTRKGSPKDEQRYDELLQRIESGELEPQTIPQQTTDQPAVHDATGKAKLVSGSKLFIFILAMIVALIVIYFQFVAPAAAQGAVVVDSSTMTLSIAQASPVPANPATLRPEADEDPAQVAARQAFFLKVFAVGAALGIVLIYLIAKYGNRKRREHLEQLDADE